MKVKYYGTTSYENKIFEISILGEKNWNKMRCGQDRKWSEFYCNLENQKFCPSTCFLQFSFQKSLLSHFMSSPQRFCPVRNRNELWFPMKCVIFLSLLLVDIIQIYPS